MTSVRRNVVIAACAFAGVLLLVLLILVVALPWYVRKRAIAMADDAGFIATIDGVRVGFGRITLRGIRAKAKATPGIAATIEETRLRGFSANEIQIAGAEMKLQGSMADLRPVLETLVFLNRGRFAGTPSSPRRITVESARLTWDGIDGEGSRLGTSDIGLDITSRGTGTEEGRASVGRFELKTSKTTLGPWSSSLETSPASTRVHVSFAPTVTDGPSALVVTGHAIPTELAVKIPRSTFKQLGIVPADFGIPADDLTEVEVKLQGRIPANERSELAIDATLFKARAKALKDPIDVHVEGKAAGPWGGPLDLDPMTVTAGPFAAAITGTITPRADGIALLANFKASPLPCETLAKAEAKNIGPLAAAIQSFGEATGAFRVTGVVNASGVLKYDTAIPEDASVTWLARETCGLSIFGQ